ncbi:unnamed protein product [Larinioides sclopetarius]|uniref:Uncharacterized protein n=1 Tax=Larinioides sclopetarius TaxID=280406 RepID=A0AAV2A5G0_9ARAC
MSLNIWVIVLLQISILFMSPKRSYAREVVRSQLQGNRIPVRFQSQTMMSQWNPVVAQSWMNPVTAQSGINPMIPQWNTGTRQKESALPSSINKNNQDFRVGSRETTSFSGLGKLRILTTLFSGLRNTGLEETIAGEIIQRLIKVVLKDIIVPFKSGLFQFS